MLIPSCLVVEGRPGWMPTKATLSLPCTSRQGKENPTKASWLEIKTRRDPSSNINKSKTDSNWGY